MAIHSFSLPLIGNIKFEFKQSFFCGFRFVQGATLHRTLPPTITYPKKIWTWGMPAEKKELENRKARSAQAISKQLNQLSIQLKGVSKHQQNDLIDSYNTLVEDIQFVFNENLPMVTSDQMNTIEKSFLTRIENLKNNSLQKRKDPKLPNNDVPTNLEFSLPLIGTLTVEYRPLNAGNKTEIQTSTKRPFPTIKYSGKLIAWSKVAKNTEEAKKELAKNVSKELNDISIKILTADISSQARNQLLENFHEVRESITEIMIGNVPLQDEKELADTRDTFNEKIKELENNFNNLMEKKNQSGEETSNPLSLGQLMQQFVEKANTIADQTNSTLQSTKKLSDNLEKNRSTVASYFSLTAWAKYGLSFIPGFRNEEEGPQQAPVIEKPVTASPSQTLRPSSSTPPPSSLTSTSLTEKGVTPQASNPSEPPPTFWNSVKEWWLSGNG